MVVDTLSAAGNGRILLYFTGMSVFSSSKISSESSDAAHLVDSVHPMEA